jgi:lysophospholipase L1-like esterase
MSLVAFVLLLPGCGGPAVTTAPPRAARGAGGSNLPAALVGKRMLALGDSYTIGEGVDPAERWPVQLVAALRARGEAFADPTIVARTGWTTDELSAAIDKARLEKPYDLVSLLIGVNNQYRGRDVEEYRGQFVTLLGRAVDFAGGTPGRVVVLSIPDWGVTPFAVKRDRGAIATAIDGFNAVNREESLRAGVRYVEITAASRRAKDEPLLIAGDGLHPSGTMYAEWVEATLPSAIAALAGAAIPEK